MLKILMFARASSTADVAEAASSSSSSPCFLDDDDNDGPSSFLTCEISHHGCEHLFSNQFIIVVVVIVI